MASSWERLASVTLPSTGDTLDSGTFTARKYLHIECYSEATGGSIQSNIRFNGTGSSDNDYCYRHSGNGGSDTTRVSRNDIEPYQASTIATGTSQYVVMDIININSSSSRLLVFKFLCSCNLSFCIIIFMWILYSLFFWVIQNK